MGSTLKFEDYTVVWIAVLPIEAEAALALLDRRHDGQFVTARGDDYIYIGGEINRHNIVIATLPEGQNYGVGAAAALVNQVKARFTNIWFALLVGVAAGLPNLSPTPPAKHRDIRLGDVLVSLPDKESSGIIHYDFGKSTEDGFLLVGRQAEPPAIIRAAISNIKLTKKNPFRSGNAFFQYLTELKGKDDRFAFPSELEDRLFEDREDNNTLASTLVPRTIRPESHRTQVWYGNIGSGNSLMRDARRRDELRDKYDLIGLEMEAAGVANTLPTGVIRGVCDYGDRHKNKDWQSYAAATAASYAKGILYTINPKEKNNTSSSRSSTNFNTLGITSLTVDDFLAKLSSVDQEDYRSKIPAPDCEQRQFYWIYRNLDFQEWNSPTSPVDALWLSGPAKYNIHQVSSEIVNTALQKPEALTLYFFCCTAVDKKTSPAPTVFVHTILDQIVNFSTAKNKGSIIKTFLLTTLNSIYERDKSLKTGPSSFKEGDSLDDMLRKTLHDPAIWDGLEGVLEEHIEEFLIVIDGVDEFERHKSKFSGDIFRVISHLQRRRAKFKALITSDPDENIGEILQGVLRLEYDKERKEYLASLSFDNTRYSKISEEHKGSLKWLWTHDKYTKWAESDESSLLCIEGKPGSGKSTLVKYFKDNLLQQLKDEGPAAVVADFFYSHREGKLQTSHYSMLRSILYNILQQREYFFYHFQSIYRKYLKLMPRRDIGEWPYELLKDILLSLSDHERADRIYLIVDAIDESDDEDRRVILNLLLELCFRSKFCVFKIFIASRPVSDVNHYFSKFHQVIRMQDETTLDIKKFTDSFLSPELGLTGDILQEATQYIIKQAQGVFLWVSLVRKELRPLLERGYREREIFDQLKALPVEMEDFYELILVRMEKGTRRDVGDGRIMFQFVLSAPRPVTVLELQHALAIAGDPKTIFTPSDKLFEKELVQGMEKRIVHCAGGLLEIKGDESVQVIHQTVREFFLRRVLQIPNSNFRMDPEEAHNFIAVTCVRYLVVCAMNTSLAQQLPDLSEGWTSKHLDTYARYLNERPLMSYALSYLKHHMESFPSTRFTNRFFSRYLAELVRDGPATFLFDRWALSLDSDSPHAAEQYRNSIKFKNLILYSAIKLELYQAAESILIAGAQIEAPISPNNKETPLIASAERGDYTMVDLLLNRKADIAARDNDKRTALHMAAYNGHFKVVELLLDNGADINAQDFSMRRPLHYAACSGHGKVVQLLLLNNKVNANAKAAGNWTALHLAALNGHESVVEILLPHVSDEHGVWSFCDVSSTADPSLVWKRDTRSQLPVKEATEISPRDFRGWSPLRLAAYNGNEKVVQMILSAAADRFANHTSAPTSINARFRYEMGITRNCPTFENAQWTTLHWAAQNGHERIVEFLLNIGADINVKDCCGWTPLHRAAANGHDGVVQLLLKKGADTEAQDNEGWPAFHIAAETGHEKTVQLMLEMGGYGVSSKSASGWTALQRAAWKGQDAVVELLIQKGERVAATHHGTRWNALHLAAWNGHDGVVQLLLRFGADIETRDNNGLTALHLAAEYGFETTLRLLLENGASVATGDYHGQIALHLGAVNGHEGVVHVLLEKGADVQAQDANGSTALHIASEKGYKNIVHSLIEAGADINVKDHNKWTPLNNAAWNRQERVIRALLKAGADVADSGWTAVYSVPWLTDLLLEQKGIPSYMMTWSGGQCRVLCRAAESGEESLVQLLIDISRIEVDITDDEGRGALYGAASNGHKRVIQVLLEHGANINIRDKEKSTALLIAAEKGHYEVVQLLLREKADISMRDKGGWTALHRAARYGHEDIVHLLLRKGVDAAAKDRDGWTALQVATEAGQEAVMQIIKKSQYQRDAETGSEDSSVLRGQHHKRRYRNTPSTDGETWRQPNRNSYNYPSKEAMEAPSASIPNERPPRTLQYQAPWPPVFNQNRRDDERYRDESRSRQRDYRPRENSQPHPWSYEYRSPLQSYNSTYEGARLDYASPQEYSESYSIPYRD